jgi:ABC-2 type transport system permease protein
MRTILFILRKEFLQIFRNKTMLPIIFVMPVIQLLILANAATFEMKNIRAYIVDMDNSTASRELISKFRGSSFYTIVDYSFDYSQGEESIKKGKSDLIIEIPTGFERDLQIDKKARVGLVADAINSTTASLAYAYTSAIIRDYNLEIVTRLIGKKAQPPIDVRYSYWYNPELDYTTYMVPGILVLLVSMIGIFLSSMNVVREKEIGTIEQLNVTPIKKYQFIAGKLLPFWIIAMFELAFGLVIAKLFFSIPIVGSLGLIFGIAAIYMIVVLSLGLIVSTISDTMQQSMFVSFFFMIIFILMSGLFTAIESMPLWAQKINIINPIAYFIKIIRMVMLKGSGFQDVLQPFISLVVYSLVALSFAVWRYRKVA